jgi:hypothetical protein
MAQRQDLECADLRLVFRWSGDRYDHVFEQRHSAGWGPLLVSIDCGPWPGPVFQHLQIEDRQDGCVALLVGQEVDRHWSASFQVRKAGHGFDADVACRIRSRLPLGSTYEVLTDPGRDAVALRAFDGETRCRLHAIDNRRLWQIEPVVSHSEVPATIRWRYIVAASDML